MLKSCKALFTASNPNAFMSASMPPAHGEQFGINTAQLRWLVLGPSMTVILIMIGIMIISVYFPANIVSLADLGSHQFNTRDIIYFGLVPGIAGGGLLFAFFWLLTGRVGQLIEHHQEALQNLATRDGLTGLFNHITFHTMLEDEVERSHRSGSAVSLLMLDLDHFAAINDKFGHAAGDMVLKELAKTIHRQSRSIDKVCRYGGEELAVILPETDTAGALIAAERMRAAIEGYLFHHMECRDISITASIGVASLPGHASSVQELVNATERALSIAKERGRNKVHQYNP